jgi:hypothetical protein
MTSDSLAKLYKRHLRAVTKAKNFSNKNYSTPFKNLFEINKLHRYVLTNNSLIDPNSIRQYSLYGREAKGKFREKFIFNKQIVDEVINSKHSFNLETRRPSSIDPLFTIYSLGEKDKHFYNKCHCLKNSLYFEYIESVDSFNRKEFWNLYGYVGQKIAEKKAEGAEFAESQKFLLDLEVSEVDVQYVRINLKNAEEVNQEYANHFTFFLESLNRPTNLLYSNWSNNRIGGWSEPGFDRSTDIVIALQEHDVVLFKDALKIWKEKY